MWSLIARAVFEEKYKGRFIFTSKKMGAQTEESNINAGVAAARQIVDYFKSGKENFRLKQIILIFLKKDGNC